MLLTKLASLIQHILPNLDSESLRLLLSKRLVKPNDLGEFLLQDDAVDFIDAKDVEKFEKLQQGLKADLSTKTALRSEWLYVCASSALKASGKRTAKPKFSNILGKPMPTRWPVGGVSAAVAQLSFPAPVRVYKDMVNHRWQSYFPGVGSRSRPFHVYGDEEGLRLLGQWAWQEVLLREGRLVSDCPIAGLFLVAAGAAASSSHASASSRRA